MTDKFNPNDYLMELGKDKKGRPKMYLQVTHRLMWFRDEHPQGSIITEMINLDPIVFKATVLSDDGRVLGTGHGSATAKAGAVWSGREVEKAETAAMGRALATAGFGSQFAEGFDDSEHLSDAPVEKPRKQTPQPRHALNSGSEASSQAQSGNAPSVGKWWTDTNENKFVREQIGLTPGNAAGKMGQKVTDFETADDFVAAYRDFANPVANQDATPAPADTYTVPDYLKGEMLHIIHVEPNGSRRFQWIAKAMFDGNPIRILLYKEDEFFIRKLGYDTTGWDSPNGRDYADGIAVITLVADGGRKVAAVWDKATNGLVTMERGR